MDKNLDDAVVVGSGNVFADVGLNPSEDDYLKFAIAHAISERIQSRKLTQVAAAKLMGIDQPKVSQIVRGRLKGLSVDRLLNWLIALGNDVELRVSPVRDGERGKVRVCG